MRHVSIPKDEMLLSEWEKAMRKACEAFAKEWNARMVDKTNIIDADVVERFMRVTLWTNYSEGVLR